jgi:uncharacterized phiE125 gp8 family phage protein
MRVRVITGPSIEEPVTLAEAKLHLRVDTTDEDSLITGLIVAARMAAEHETGRALINQTLRLTLDAFPADGAIELLRPPVASITQVQYVDTAGATQTLSSTLYSLDSASAFATHYLLPSYGSTWPATRDQANSVWVDYVAGYGAAATAVPQPIKQWILLAIGDLYANRERSAEKPAVPHGFVAGLLDPYRVWGV